MHRNKYLHDVLLIIDITLLEEVFELYITFYLPGTILYFYSPLKEKIPKYQIIKKGTEACSSVHDVHPDKHLHDVLLITDITSLEQIFELCITFSPAWGDSFSSIPH